MDIVIDQGNVVRMQFNLMAEQGHDGLRIVVIDVVLVEAVEQCYLLGVEQRHTLQG